MLYKNSLNGLTYKSENCVVNHRPNGSVSIHIGKTAHSLNYISTEAFELALLERSVIYFRPCFKSIADSYDKASDEV